MIYLTATTATTGESKRDYDIVTPLSSNSGKIVFFSFYVSRRVYGFLVAQQQRCQTIGDK